MPKKRTILFLSVVVVLFSVIRSRTLIRSVSPQRLSELNPGKPDAYREYAEELAEKRKDPDAQETSIRLFQIAAVLEPERLGRSCLLGMVPLSNLAAGFLAEAVGPVVAWALAGAAMLGITTLAFVMTPVRRFEWSD